MVNVWRKIMVVLLWEQWMRDKDSESTRVKEIFDVKNTGTDLYISC